MYFEDGPPMHPEGEEPVERANRTLDIATLPPDQFDLFMAGYEAGRASGLDDGYAACEERYALVHRLSFEAMTRNRDFEHPDGHEG